MKAKLKDLLRRALVGLLSVSMIAADLPVAVFAAEPTEATAVEATATEETTAATEAVATEAAATEAVEATEAVVTEATATEAVEVEATEAAEPTEAVEAETVEETDEADADKEAKEEVKAEEAYDAYGNNPDWDTYFLRFYFGSDDDAKAVYESISKNGITAGTQLTDAKSDAVNVNKRDEKDINNTFGVPVNGTGAYWLEYAVSVNRAYRQSISENGFTGLFYVDGFNFDGDKHFDYDDGIGYWDFSKARMYIYAQKDSINVGAQDSRLNFYYDANPFVTVNGKERFENAVNINLGNGSSDDNIKFEVAYANPTLKIQDANGHNVPKYQPVWYTVGGKTELKFATSNKEFWLRVSGFQNDLGAYTVPTGYAEKNEDQKYYLYHYDTSSSNLGDFTVGDATKAPFITFNVHNAGTVPIAFQYKTKNDGTLTKLAEIPAGGQLNAFTVNRYDIDDGGISFNASATDHAYYKWAVKDEANLFTNAEKKKTDEKDLAFLNLARLKNNAYTEKKGSGENEEYVIDIWLKEAPEFDAKYAFTGFDSADDVVYISNDPELLRGDLAEVAARVGTTGSKKFVAERSSYSSVYWTLSAGEKIYVRMFNDDGYHFSADLATLASKQEEVSTGDPIYSVSENSDADVVRKNTELIALGDDIYSLEFKSASTKGMTDKSLGITVKKVSAVHALKVNVDDGVEKIKYPFEETVNGKERFYTLKGIPDKDDAYFYVDLNTGYKIVSVKNAELVDAENNEYAVRALTSDAEVTVVTAKDNASTVSINFAMAPSMDAEAAKAISVYRVTEGIYSTDNSSNYSYIGEYKLGTTYGFTSGQQIAFVLDDEDYQVTRLYAEGAYDYLGFGYSNELKAWTVTIPDISTSKFDTTDGAVNNVYIYVKKKSDLSKTYTFEGDLDHVAIYTDEQGDALYNDKIEQNSYTTADKEFKFIVIPDPGYELTGITGVLNNKAKIFTSNGDSNIKISTTYRKDVESVKTFKIKTDGTIDEITIDGGNIEVTKVDKNNFVVSMTPYQYQYLDEYKNNKIVNITHYMMFKYDDKEIDHLNIVEPHAAVDEEKVIRYNLAEGPYPFTLTKEWEGGTMNISADYGFSGIDSPNLEKNFYGIYIFNEDALSVFGRNDIYLRKHDDKDSKVDFTLSGDYARYASVSWDKTKDPNHPVYDLVVKRIDTKVNELGLYREDGSRVPYIVDDDGNFVFENIGLGNGWATARTFDMYVLKLFRHIPGQTFTTNGDVKLTFWTVENGQKVRLTDPYLVTANETETNGSFYRITGFTGSYTVEAKSESGLVLKGFADAEQVGKYSTKPEEFAITPLASFSVADGKADAEYYGFMQPYFKVWLSSGVNGEFSQFVTNGGSISGIPAGTEYKIQYYNGFGEAFTSAAEIPASLSGGMTQGKDIFSDHLGLATVFIDQVDAGKTLTYQYKLDKGNTEFFPDGSIKITTASAADTQYSLTTKVDTVSSCEIKTPEIVNPGSVTLKYDPLKIDGTTKEATKNGNKPYTRVDQIYENKGKAQILTYPTTDVAYKTQETSVSMNVNGVTVGNIKVTIAPPEMNGKTLALNADKLKATTTGDQLSIVVPTPEELGFKVDETVVGGVYWKVSIKGDVEDARYNTQYFNYYKTEYVKNNTGVYVPAYELDKTNGHRIPVTSVLVSGLKAAQEYKFTLQLVQTSETPNLVPQNSPDDSAITETTVFSTTLAPDDQWFTVKTKTEYYATKLKLSKKSATIYTGQQDLYVCDVTLPEKELASETLDRDRVVQIAQVGTTGTAVYADVKNNTGWLKAEVRDGKLYLSVPYDQLNNCHAGKYTMEVRTQAPGSTYWATARFNLTVKQGIQTVNLNLKNKIYVPSGSTTTLKVKPTFNELGSEIFTMEKINDTLAGTDLYDFADANLTTCVTAPATKKLDWANAQVEYFKVDAVADNGKQEDCWRAAVYDKVNKRWMPKKGLWLPYDGQGGPSFSIAKNGTIKVSGSGDSETWYRIKVKAADYKDSKIYSYYNSEFQVISNDEYKDAKLIVIDANDTHINDNGLTAYRVLGTYGDKNKITLKSTELDAAIDRDKTGYIGKNIRVVVDKDASRNMLAAADGVAHEYVPIDSLAYSSINNFNIGLEFKPVKSKGFNLSKEGFFTYKHAKDSKKITATTLNGSLQKKLDATIAIEYEGPKFGLEILDEDGKVINYKNGSSNMGEDRYKGEAQEDVFYYGTEADFVGLRLMIYNPANSKEGIWTRSNFNDPNGEAKNFVITVKGGKLQKPVVERNLEGGKYTEYGVYKNASVYYLNVKPNNKNGVATITVKNKLDKTSKTYYVTNKTKPGTGKVKVTSNRKNLLDKAGEDQTITFKPSGLDESKSQYYLKIDRVQKNVYSGSYEQLGKKEFIDKAADWGFSRIENAGRDALKVDELIPVKQSEGYAYEAKIGAQNYVYPGNYKYVFTYGTLDTEGNFEPVTKAQNFIIKIKGDKTNSFKIKTNYKLAARDQYKLEVEGKSKGVEYVSVDEVLYANVMGNSNKFMDLITINKNGGRGWIGYGNWYNGKYHNDALAIKAFTGNTSYTNPYGTVSENTGDNYLTVGQLKIDLSKITSKVDLTGYIKYTVHYKATGVTGATDEQKYAKIKITLGKDEAKTVRRFKAKSNGAMMNQDLTPFVGYIELTAGGKPVSLSDYVGIKSDNGIFTYAEVMNVEAVENELGFVSDGTKKYVKIYSSTDKAVLSKIFDPVKAGKQKIKSENVTLYVLPKDSNIYYNVVDSGVDNNGRGAEIQKDKNATMDYVSEYGVPVSCKVKLVPAASATKALSLVEKKVPSWDGMFTGKTYNTWNYEYGTWYAYVPVKENLAVNGRLVTIKAKDWCDNPKYSQFMSFDYDNSYKDKAYMTVAIEEDELKKAVEKNIVKYGETADVALSVYLGIEGNDVKKDTEASIKDWTINVTLPDPYAGVDPNAAAEAIDKDVKKLADAAINTDAKRGQLLELIDIERGNLSVADYEEAIEDAILENIYGNVDDWSYIVVRNWWNGKRGIEQDIRTKENELIASDSATNVSVVYDSKKNIATVKLTRNSLDGKTSETRDFRFSPNVKKDDAVYSGSIVNWLTLNRKSFNNETDPKEIAKAVRAALNVPENIGITAEKVDVAVSDSKLLIVRFTLSDLYETDTDATFTAIFSKGAKTTLSEAYAISIAAIREGFTKGYTQGLSVSEDAAEVAKAANAYVDALGYEVKAEKDKEFDTNFKYLITVTDKATKAEKSGEFVAEEIREESGSVIIGRLNKGGYINTDYLKKNKYGDWDYTYDGIMAAIRAQWPEAVFEASKDDYQPANIENEGKITIKASASGNGAYESEATFGLNPDKETRYTASDYVTALGSMKRTLHIGDKIGTSTTPIDFNNTDWVFRDFDYRATESTSINGAGRGYTRTISAYEYVAPTATDDGKVSLTITVSRDGETASTTGLVMTVEGKVYTSAAQVLDAAKAISVTAADASEAAYQKKLDAIKFNAESITVRAGSMVKTTPTKVKDGTVSFIVDATVMQSSVANKASLRITYTLPAEGNQLIAEAEAAAKAEVAKIQKELNDGTLDWKNLTTKAIQTRIDRATTSSTLVSDDYSSKSYNDYNKNDGLYFSPVGKGVDGFVKGTVVLYICDAEVYVPIDLTIPAK